VQRRPARTGGLRSPREPSIRVPPPRERRHGHGLEVRDVPSGPPSRAEDELGFREGVQALRRAVSSLSRLPDGGNRAELCEARGLANASVLPPGIGVGPIEGERETAVERTPAEPGHLEERGSSGSSSPRRPFSRRSCTSWRRGERRRPSLRWCGRGPVRDPAGVRTFRLKAPVNEIRSDAGTTASLVTPRRRSSPGVPDSARSRATWSRPTSERLASRR